MTRIVVRSFVSRVFLAVRARLLLDLHKSLCVILGEKLS